MRMFWLLFAAATWLACDVIEPKTGPGTDYPCGVGGVQCSSHMCCNENETCGGDDPSCPKGMCCFIGGEYAGASRPHPQRPAR